MSAQRCPENPIITPANVKPLRDDYEVIGTFNTAVARYGDEVILLLRVAERPLANNKTTTYAPIYDLNAKEVALKGFVNDDPAVDLSDPRLIQLESETYLTNISHLRLARSKDGVHFDIEETAALSAETEYETFGLEDPRITQIGDTYYINYVGVSPMGVTTCLASTKDFITYQRHGIVFCPDNKDVVMFPERICGKYFAIHRPASGLFKKNDMWLARSGDLLCWGDHRYLLSQGSTGWDCARIGAGAVPFKTEKGWVEIYHGADENNRYCLGALLLDTEEPWKLLARSTEPVFVPEVDYECQGFFGNVVFTCGLLCEDNIIKLYYGASDTTTCYAQLELSGIMKTLK